MGDPKWWRIAGLRVVLAWPETRYAIPPKRPANLRARAAGVAGALSILGGIVAVVAAIGAQDHAPQPAKSAAGATGPAAGQATGPWVQRSVPVSIAIPAIGVNSNLLHLGLNSDGTIQVPSLSATPGEAAWYKYSATPGQIGVSVIEGHVDSYRGPAVFFVWGGCVPVISSTCGSPTGSPLYSASPVCVSTLNRGSQRKSFTARPGTRHCA